MNDEQAILICKLWFEHLESEKERTAKLQAAAALARQGKKREAFKLSHDTEHSPKVYDGAILEPAVRHLVDRVENQLDAGD